LHNLKIFKESGISQIDPDLITTIDKYVKEGETSTRQMKRLLKIHVKDMFGDTNVPDPSNKRFYPRMETIRNHISRSRRKLCLSNRPRSTSIKNPRMA